MEWIFLSKYSLHVVLGHLRIGYSVQVLGILKVNNEFSFPFGKVLVYFHIFFTSFLSSSLLIFSIFYMLMIIVFLCGVSYMWGDVSACNSIPIARTLWTEEYKIKSHSELSFLLAPDWFGRYEQKWVTKVMLICGLLCLSDWIRKPSILGTYYWLCTQRSPLIGLKNYVDVENKTPLVHMTSKSDSISFYWIATWEISHCSWHIFEIGWES